jgi:hypothetical protein
MDRVVAASDQCPQCAGEPLYRRGKVPDPQRFRCRRCGRTFNTADVAARPASAGSSRLHTDVSGTRPKSGAVAAPVAVDFVEWAHDTAASRHGSSMRKRLEYLFGGRPNGKHPH